VANLEGSHVDEDVVDEVEEVVAEDVAEEEIFLLVKVVSSRHRRA